MLITWNNETRCKRNIKACLIVQIGKSGKEDTTAVDKCTSENVLLLHHGNHFRLFHFKNQSVDPWDWCFAPHTQSPSECAICCWWRERGGGSGHVPICIFPSIPLHSCLSRHNTSEVNNEPLKVQLSAALLISDYHCTTDKLPFLRKRCDGWCERFLVFLCRLNETKWCLMWMF